LLDKNPDIADYFKKFVEGANGHGDGQAAVQAMFERESSIAGYLSFLGTHSPSTLTGLFYRQPGVNLLEAMQFADPLLNFGANNYEAILSPIGIVHLFREYFFEFDSFLGPAVGHQWLSPGGTVELIEINTRKVFTERTMELMTETTMRSESDTTTQDDIADAVKEENRNDIKFGFSNVASYSSPFFQDTATASFSLDNAKTETRETTHKQMRQQSEKLSSEIKRNFRTTFKTSTEVTDTSSKRYVLQNTTDKLVNYELRRKMRKVGVQVQDIGTQLCWTAFVDDPGRELGIAQLVHIAKAAELGDLPQPDAPEMPKAVAQDVNINVPFVGVDTDDTDNAYTDGTETEVGFLDDTEHIVADFPQSVVFTQPGYTLQKVDLDAQGADAKLSARGVASEDGSSTGSFTIHLDYVNWHGQSNIPVKATLLWAPGADAINAVNAEYAKRMESYNAEKARRFKEAFYNAARERIKAAAAIQPRLSEELREEERTVVYRTLIKQLMSVGNGSKHVVSELVRSIFDVDKMLYFVAPEWWAPRLHESGQHLGEEPSSNGNPGNPGPSTMAMRKFSPGAFTKVAGFAGVTGVVAGSRGTPIPSEDIVDWGGAREAGRDNYYITEDSAPAKLGSSLGWLLQLDGDNLRNAFLNSPWVKAVIPIRLGKEHEAVNWLQQAHVEGSDGLDAEYSASADDPPELHSSPGHDVTIEDALNYLIEKIHDFNEKASTPVMPDPANPQDPANHFAGSLPTEAVFEHGFYPLQGGVHFEGEGTEQTIFSQWLEILPTDQIVALQIEYDPKTLQVKDPS
jgi:DNA-directed RNA polymerase subunit F